jgi:hypothetical protein
MTAIIPPDGAVDYAQHIDAREAAAMLTDPDAQARAWTEYVARQEFARDVSNLAGELEQKAAAAREVLADRRLAADELAAVRDRLVRACLAAGSVAIDAEAAP